MGVHEPLCHASDRAVGEMDLEHCECLKEKEDLFKKNLINSFDEVLLLEVLGNLSMVMGPEEN